MSAWCPIRNCVAARGLAPEIHAESPLRVIPEGASRVKRVLLEEELDSPLSGTTSS